jgi:hypothetical protein
VNQIQQAQLHKKLDFLKESIQTIEDKWTSPDIDEAMAVQQMACEAYARRDWELAFMLTYRAEWCLLFGLEQLDKRKEMLIALGEVFEQAARKHGVI